MKLMKIGLNGQKLLIDSPAGPEKYTYNLFQALAKIDKENKYIIYLDKKPGKEWFKNLTCNNPNCSYVVIPNTLFWTQINLAAELLNNPPDVFFTAIHTIPMVRSSKTKFVTMIHGLEYKYTAGYDNPIYRFKIDRPVKYTAQHSDKIIVPSQATKSALLKQTWGIDREKIEIIYEGVNTNFKKKTVKDVNLIRERYEIGQSSYLLFVSTIQPRKNIPNTVAAFSKLIKENTKFKDTKLLLAGKFGWDFNESLDSPKKYGVEKNVLFLGRVLDEDLPSLFSGAKGYINMSLEEGFGLPLLEAMSCETPCLVSDIPAFDEIGSGFPVFADPNNIENMKEGMVAILSGKVSDEHRKESRKYAQSFTWENTAKRTLAVLENLVKNA
ncbi:MAG: glycosyltransferase family 1 protein [Patescibacteria group bacterium]